MRKNFPLIMLALLGFSNCKKDDTGKIQPPAGPRKVMPVQVEAVVATYRSLSENLEVPGTLLPFEETEIRPEISGRLVKMNIVEGATVQAGTLLAKLFDDDLQAQLKKLEVQLQIAQKTLERQQELLKIQGISQQEVDLTELQVNNIKADMELVRVNISKTEIRAPYTGRLGLRNVSLGAYISPTTLLTTLRQLNNLKLDFTAPEKYGEYFQKDKKIQFTVTGSNRGFTANVLATESKINPDTRSIQVRALVQESSPSLLPGAFAKVQFSTGANDKAVVVPTQSIIPKARTSVVVVYKNGQPDFRTVETGLRDATHVQILDGVAIGDTVVVTGLLAIREGSQLKLSKVTGE